MQSSSPWYKQVWPWVLILIPFTSVIMGFVIAYVSTSGKDSLVIDDYYKEGRAINKQLLKIEQAQQLGIAGNLTVQDGEMVFVLDDAAQHDGTALTLNFFHATLKEKDFDIRLIRSSDNRYHANYSGDISGKWRVTMTPFNDAWKVQSVFTLPRADAIRIAP